MAAGAYAPTVIIKIIDDAYASSPFSYSPKVVRSTTTPGPIVDDTVTLRMYTPLAVAGFTLTKSANNACKFSLNFSGEKLARPTWQCTMPDLSQR